MACLARAAGWLILCICIALSPAFLPQAMRFPLNSLNCKTWLLAFILLLRTCEMPLSGVMAQTLHSSSFNLAKVPAFLYMKAFVQAGL